MSTVTVHIDIEGGWGGSSRSLFELIKSLDRDKISPVVIHRQEGPIVDQYAQIGVPTYHVPEIFSFVPREKKSLRNFIFLLPRLKKIYEGIRRVNVIIGKHNAELVHLNYEGLFLLPRWITQPVVAHVRTLLPKNLWSRWIVRRISAYADHTFYISPMELARWMELGGKNPGEVMWNVFRDPPQLRTASPPMVLFLGSLNYSKGVDRIVDIAQAVRRKKGPLFTFVIHGVSRTEPKFALALEQRCRKLGLTEVVFRGHIPPENILPEAFALIRPSRNNDPWGRDVLEATSCGVPVLATGHHQIIINDGKNGYLFKKFDADAFADKLIELHDNPALWQSMSKSGIELGRKRFSGAGQAAMFTRAVERLTRKPMVTCILLLKDKDDNITAKQMADFTSAKYLGQEFKDQGYQFAVIDAQFNTPDPLPLTHPSQVTIATENLRTQAGKA